ASAGQHTAEVEITLQTKPQAAFVTYSPPMPADDPESSRRIATLTFEVLAEDAPGVEILEPSPDVKKKMEALLDPTQINVTHWTGGGAFMPNYHAGMMFSIDNPPMPVAFDVLWKSGDKEWPIGSFTTGTSAGDDNFFMGP